jgi:hypothetical protein
MSTRQASGLTVAVVTKALGRLWAAFTAAEIAGGVELTARAIEGGQIREDLADGARLLRAAGFDATAFGCALFVSLPVATAALPWEPMARAS